MSDSAKEGKCFDENFVRMSIRVLCKLLSEADDDMKDHIRQTLVLIVKGKPLNEIQEIFRSLIRCSELGEQFVQLLMQGYALVEGNMGTQNWKDVEDEERKYDHYADKLLYLLNYGGNSSRHQEILYILATMCHTIYNNFFEDITRIEAEYPCSKADCRYLRRSLNDVYLLDPESIGLENAPSWLLESRATKDPNPSVEEDPLEKDRWLLKTQDGEEDDKWEHWEEKLNKDLFPDINDHVRKEDTEWEKKLNEALADDIIAIAKESKDPSRLLLRLEKEIAAIAPSRVSGDCYPMHPYYSHADTEGKKRRKVLRAWLDEGWGSYSEVDIPPVFDTEEEKLVGK